MDYDYLAKEILKSVGGNSNVKGIMNCFTRVRVEVKDKSLVRDDGIKKLEGVQGISWIRSQCQIIMGSHCHSTFEALEKIVVISKDSEIKSEIKKKENIGVIIIDYITNSIQPVIPILIAAGMVQGILALLAYLNINTDTYLFQVLNACGQAGYYFLPIFLAFSAGKKLGVNPYIAASVGAVLI